MDVVSINLYPFFDRFSPIFCEFLGLLYTCTFKLSLCKPLVKWQACLLLSILHRRQLRNWQCMSIFLENRFPTMPIPDAFFFQHFPQSYLFTNLSNA